MRPTFTDKVLEGKAAYVAGGTRGINLGIARFFAEHGAAVAVMSRNVERCAAAEAELRALGGRALGLSGDVRSYDRVHETLKQAAEAFGPLDIVGIVDNRSRIKFRRSWGQTAGPTAQQRTTDERLGNTFAIQCLADRLAELVLTEKGTYSFVAIILQTQCFGLIERQFVGQIFWPPTHAELGIRFGGALQCVDIFA